VFTLTPEAKAWYDAVATFARGQSVAGDRLRVEFCVYLGKGERGDVDNFCKCILDGLVKAHVIETDDSVVEMHIYKDRDRENPRTEILITEAKVYAQS
jgi:Holliday junction resolvase RusA-like endonuclease